VDGGYLDLGVLSNKKGITSAARSINNSGQVAGECRDRWNVKGFRYTDGDGLVDLGTLGGKETYVTGWSVINNFGDCVGRSETSAGEVHVFLYTDALGMADVEAVTTNLPADLTGLLKGPLLLNDAQVICGRAGDGTATQASLNGNTHEAYVLFPAATSN
jgi:probable HAF family extracellular repeat protein